MHLTPNRRRPDGFTLIELLAVIAVTGILLAVLLPVIARERYKAERTSCMSNLSQLSKSCIIYSMEHGEKMPVSFKSLGPYVGNNAKIFHCKGDRARETCISTNIIRDLDPATCSYVLNIGDGTGVEDSSQTGDVILLSDKAGPAGTDPPTVDNCPGVLFHGDGGNMAHVDGSVIFITAEEWKSLGPKYLKGVTHWSGE